jgi:hypothetical protein
MAAQNWPKGHCTLLDLECSEGNPLRLLAESKVIPDIIKENSKLALRVVPSSSEASCKVFVFASKEDGEAVQKKLESVLDSKCEVKSSFSTAYKCEASLKDLEVEALLKQFPPQALLEGQLYFKGGFLKGKQEMHFTLHKGVLVWRKTKESTELAGCIPLETLTKVETSTSFGTESLKLAFTGKTKDLYLYRDESKKQIFTVKDWQTNLERCLLQLQPESKRLKGPVFNTQGKFWSRCKPLLAFGVASQSSFRSDEMSSGKRMSWTPETAKAAQEEAEATLRKHSTSQSTASNGSSRPEQSQGGGDSDKPNAEAKQSEEKKADSSTPSTATTTPTVSEPEQSPEKDSTPTKDTQKPTESEPQTEEAADRPKDEGPCLNCCSSPRELHCINCRSSFCLDCDKEIHQGPVLGAHQREALSPRAATALGQ